MPDVLSTQHNFKSLSLKDLLEARDLYTDMDTTRHVARCDRIAQ